MKTILATAALLLLELIGRTDAQFCGTDTTGCVMCQGGYLLNWSVHGLAKLCALTRPQLGDGAECDLSGLQRPSLAFRPSRLLLSILHDAGALLGDRQVLCRVELDADRGSVLTVSDLLC